MADDVKLTFTGNAADAEKAIAQLERKYDTLEQKIKRLGTASRQAAKDSSSGWESLGNTIGSVATKYVSIAAAIKIASDAAAAAAENNKRAQDRLSDFASTFRETEVKFQVQTGLQGAGSAAAIDRVVNQLRRTPVTDLQSAIAISQQVASAGFTQADVQSGASTGAVLDLLAGTNSVGRSVTDPKEMVKSLSMTLKGSGVTSPTAGDIRNFGGTLTELFDASTIEFSDLKQLAPKLAPLKQFGVDLKLATSAFAGLVDVMGGERGATGLATFVSRTATATNVEERKRTLISAGIDPNSVAMAEGGVGFFDALDVIRNKMKGMKQEDQNRFLENMYGQETMPAAAYLLSDEGFARVQEFRNRVENPDVFNRNVDAFRNSRFANNQRMQLAGNDAMRSTLEQTPLTFAEVRQGITAGADRARSFVDLSGGGYLQRMAARTSISMGEFGFGAMASAGEMFGMQPSDLGFKPSGEKGESTRKLQEQSLEMLRSINRNLSEKNQKRQGAAEGNN